MRRQFGVLLPLFSLARCEQFDHAASFIDFLAKAQAGCWQILPIGPPDETGSPYLAQSAFAGNPDLIGTQMLGGTVAEKFETDNSNPAVAAFATEAASWLADYALFRVMSKSLA